MLDDLIDLLGTDEEIINDELLKDELVEEEASSLEINLPERRTLYTILAIILALLILRKYYLYFAWKYFPSGNAQLKRFYKSVAAMLMDLGLQKKTGETKEEFAHRIKNKLNWDSKELVDVLNMTIFQQSTKHENNLNPKDLYQDFYSKLSRKQKLSLILNPRSTFSWGTK